MSSAPWTSFRASATSSAWGTPERGEPRRGDRPGDRMIRVPDGAREQGLDGNGGIDRAPDLDQLGEVARSSSRPSRCCSAAVYLPRRAPPRRGHAGSSARTANWSTAPSAARVNPTPAMARRRPRKPRTARIGRHAAEANAPLHAEVPPVASAIGAADALQRAHESGEILTISKLKRSASSSKRRDSPEGHEPEPGEGGAEGEPGGEDEPSRVLATARSPIRKKPAVHAGRSPCPRTAWPISWA